MFWLELMNETGYLTDVEFKVNHDEGKEIIRLLTSIIKTTQANIDH